MEAVSSPQTLLTSSIRGQGAHKSILKNVGFDSEVPEFMPSARGPGRKSTPWLGGNKDDVRNLLPEIWKAVQFAEDASENGSKLAPSRRQRTRKATPYLCKTELPQLFPDEDASSGEEHCTEDTSENRPTRTPPRIRWSASAELSYVDSFSKVPEPRHGRRSGRKSTPGLAKVKVAEIAEKTDKVAEIAERCIQWSLEPVEEESVHSVLPIQESVEIARRPARKCTPYLGNPKVADSNESESTDARIGSIQWSDSVQESSARRPDRKSTPFCASVPFTEGVEADEKRVRWLESIEQVDADGAVQDTSLDKTTSIERNDKRRGTPWKGDLHILTEAEEKLMGRLKVGDCVEIASVAIMRQDEDLESPIVRSFPPESRFEVMEIGTGRRICVHCEEWGRCGWISAVGTDGLELVEIVGDDYATPRHHHKATPKPMSLLPIFSMCFSPDVRTTTEVGGLEVVIHRGPSYGDI